MSPWSLLDRIRRKSRLLAFSYHQVCVCVFLLFKQARSGIPLVAKPRRPLFHTFGDLGCSRRRAEGAINFPPSWQPTAKTTSTSCWTTGAVLLLRLHGRPKAVTNNPLITSGINPFYAPLHLMGKGRMEGTAAIAGPALDRVVDAEHRAQKNKLRSLSRSPCPEWTISEFAGS